MRLLLVGVGSDFILGGGEEFGQGLGFTASVSFPVASTSTRRSGSGSQPGTLEQPLGLAGHVAFLEVVDELHRLLALCLANGLENARFGDPAEIVVDGRPPAHCCHVESDGAGKDVGVIEPSYAVRGDAALIVAVGGLVERIDRG